MKTVTQIKQHFSDEEIKLLIEIIKGKLEFSVMEESIKDFYADEYNEGDLKADKFFGEEPIRNDLLEKLEFDLEVWGLILTRP